MKNFRIIFLITVITSHAAIFAQESVYEKECRKIDEYIYSGDFAGGIEYLKQKIALYDSPEPPLDSNYSFYQQELGKLYYYTCKYKLAEKAFIESINYDKELLGEKSEDYISGLSVLLELYREMGLYEKSLSVVREADSLYNQIEIRDSVNYAYYLNNAGVLYFSLGNISKAEEYLNASEIINDILLPDNHPEKAPLLNNLAKLYKEKGQYGKAEDLYKKMLEIDREYYGRQHIIIAQDLHNLGVLYTTIGNLSEAEKQLTQAKSIYEFNNDKKLGYVYTLINLAAIYVLRNELSEAELLCYNTFDITDSLVSKSHRINTLLLSRLSNIYYYRKEYKRVVETLSESKEILIKINPNHISLVNQLYNMGRAYYGLKEYDSAEIKYKEALRIAEFNYEKNHKDYVKSLNSLAQVLYEKNKKAESKSLFVESRFKFVTS